MMRSKPTDKSSNAAFAWRPISRAVRRLQIAGLSRQPGGNSKKVSCRHGGVAVFVALFVFLLGIALVLGRLMDKEVRKAAVQSTSDTTLGYNPLGGTQLPPQRPSFSVEPSVFIRRPGSTIRNAFLEVYGKSPLVFEANQGQADSRVKFLTKGFGYSIFLTANEAVLVLRRPGDDIPTPNALPQTESLSVLRMRFVGANRSPRIFGAKQLPGKVNYFIGKDPKQWRSAIPTYSQVRYQDVYPGVSVVYYGAPGRLEYDLLLDPRVDPKIITLACQGAYKTRIDAQGNLRLRVAGGEVLLGKPRIYQRTATGRKRIAGGYVLKTGGLIGIEVGEYDRSQPLIIDPVLSYSTYLGGNGYDAAYGIAVDASGNAYITGFARSGNFPVTSGAYHTTCGTAGNCNGGYADLFVAKLSSSGTTLDYSTYIGGSLDDIGKAIAVDSSGAAYITGQTFSSDFPTTTAAFQRTYGGTGDAFIVKLSSTGSSLVYSTYVGGSKPDTGNAIALDSKGNAYITGATYSADFPTTNPVQTVNGGDADAFVMEINANGAALAFSTYLGGSSPDWGSSIAVTPLGDTVYVAGSTKSGDFPTASPLQATCASCPTYADAFVAAINPSGALRNSTFLGGSSDDKATAIALDPTGNIYVTGFTFSTNFPTTTGAYQTSLPSGTSGAFVAKIAPNLRSLVYSTYLHGNVLDFGRGIAVDTGNVFVAGQTYSTTFPLANATQTACSLSNCWYGTGFVTELNAAGSGLIFSTYLGGNHGDQIASVVLDSSANPYVTGETSSANFPVLNGFQGVYGGSYGDAFVSSFSLSPAVALSPSSLTFNNQGVGTTSPPQTVTLTSNGTAPVHITSVTATGDFTETDNCGNGVAAGSICTINITFTPAATGTRTGTLTITDNAIGSPQTAGLTGTGASAPVPVAGVSPTTLTYASQMVGTTSAAQAVTLSNTGNAALSVTSIAVTGTNAGDFGQTNNCGTSVAAGASCTINVTFTPSATGTRTGTLTVSDNASGSPQTVGLTGTGASAPAPVAGVSPTSLAYASQIVGTTSAAQAVTLSNTGNAALSITSIAVTGTNAGDFAQTNNCGTSVAAGASCTINVTFTPAATGTRTGTLTITDNASGSPQTVGLTGTGGSVSAPAVSLSPTNLTFASQTVGTTSTAQAVTLSNTGSAPLSITSIAITGTNAGDFGQTNNCGTSVAAGASCAINVRFTPTATGTRTGTLTITDNAPDSPESASLSGPGASATSSNCTKFVSPGGSDANNGSSGSPWQTLQKAFNSSLAGDVVCLEGGTYPTQSTTTYSQIMNNSGVAGNPITIQNFPGQVAIVQGNTRVSGAFVTFKGASLTPPFGLAFQVGAAGLPLDGIDVLNTHDVTFDHVEITGFDNRAAYSQSGGCNNKVLASYIHDNGTSTSVSGIAWGSTASGCPNGGLLADNVIEHNSSIGIQLYSAGSNVTPSNVLVEENTVVLQAAYGMAIYGDNNVVANNILYGNGDAQSKNQGVIYTGTAQTVDHNVTFDAASSSRSGWYLAGGCCLANNLTEDPLFVSVSTKNWHLTSSSRAIGFSNSSYVQAADKDGVTRGPSYDAGAYQFVSVALSPNSLTFATQSVGTTSAPQTVNLSNNAKTTLSITSISITGTNTADFAQSNTCGASVAAGGSCTISATFTPSAIGSRAASISIADNANGSPQTVSLTGSGQ